MYRTPGRARGPCPTKCSAVGRGPCVPPHTAPLVNTMSLRDQFANWSWQSAFPSLKALFAARKKGPASRQDPLSVSKSLAEFAARRRQRNEIIFSRDMCVRENTSQAASVEFLRMAQKLCAQQTAILLSEKPGGFFDSLRRSKRFVPFCFCCIPLILSGRNT